MVTDSSVTNCRTDHLGAVRRTDLSHLPLFGILCALHLAPCYREKLIFTLCVGGTVLLSGIVSSPLPMTFIYSETLPAYLAPRLCHSPGMTFIWRMSLGITVTLSCPPLGEPFRVPVCVGTAPGSGGRRVPVSVPLSLGPEDNMMPRNGYLQPPQTLLPFHPTGAIEGAQMFHRKMSFARRSKAPDNSPALSCSLWHPGEGKDQSQKQRPSH